MAELILVPFGEDPADVSKIGAPSKNEMVFVYDGILLINGKFDESTDERKVLKDINSANRNYVKRM